MTSETKKEKKKDAFPGCNVYSGSSFPAAKLVFMFERLKKSRLTVKRVLHLLKWQGSRTLFRKSGPEGPIT
ncbi:hypothetical protein ILYODFUR_029252 [Ilyodon furcidens]|uniref:Uncharacterized protein n=1 Tax=Ilyodon furcidens TaxID=33524 RepID=A0ABV0TRE9_9TELE